MRSSRALAATVAAALVLAPVALVADPAHATMSAVIVVERQPDSDAAEDAVRSAGGAVGRQLAFIDGFAATVPTPSVADLERHTSVRAVSRNAPVTMNDTIAMEQYDALPPDVSWPQSAGLTGLPAGIDGRGVTVAVLDTGLVRHPDLGNRVVARVDMTEGADGFDRYGHGSHMSGLVAGDGRSSAGRWRGAAPGAGVVSVKVADWNGATDVSQVVAGLEWVASHQKQFGIRVLSLSFGTESSQKADLDPLNHAVQKLWSSGVLVVVAAGNRGDGKVDKPGDDPYVLTVGAADTRGTADTRDDLVAPFSGGGTTQEGVEKPDVLAPGISLVSHRAVGSTLDAMRPRAREGDRYFRGSGTSQATAVVAGAAALVLQAAPALTPDQVKQTLIRTTTTTLASQDAGGNGIVHAARAVRAAQAGTYRGTPANVGLKRAVGTGSIDSSRGGMKPYTDWKEAGKAEQVSGEYDALGRRWDAATWARRPWTSSSWASSPWARYTRVHPGWSTTASGTVAPTWSGLGWDEITWTGRSWHDVGLTPEGWTGRSWHAGVWG